MRFNISVKDVLFGHRLIPAVHQTARSCAIRINRLPTTLIRSSVHLARCSALMQVRYHYTYQSLQNYSFPVTPFFPTACGRYARVWILNNILFSYVKWTITSIAEIPCKAPLLRFICFVLRFLTLCAYIEKVSWTGEKYGYTVLARVRYSEKKRATKKNLLNLFFLISLW